MSGNTNALVVLHDDAFEISFHVNVRKQKKTMDVAIAYIHRNKKLTKRNITYNVSLSLLNKQLQMICHKACSFAVLFSHKFLN